MSRCCSGDARVSEASSIARRASTAPEMASTDAPRGEAAWAMADAHGVGPLAYEKHWSVVEVVVATPPRHETNKFENERSLPPAVTVTRLARRSGARVTATWRQSRAIAPAQATKSSRSRRAAPTSLG